MRDDGREHKRGWIDEQVCALLAVCYFCAGGNRVQEGNVRDTSRDGSSREAR